MSPFLVNKYELFSLFIIIGAHDLIGYTQIDFIVNIATELILLSMNAIIVSILFNTDMAYTKPMATSNKILATSFDKVALQYDSSRPNYSLKIFDNFPDSFRTDCKCIVEVGAGTGLFTQLLVDYFPSNTRIIATEPLKNMRDILCKKFSNHENVEIYHGLSNNLCVVNDNSVDAIFVAQAFHWFSNIETLKEFERILSPKNSYCVLVWNLGAFAEEKFLRILIKKLFKLNDNTMPKSSCGNIKMYQRLENELLSGNNLKKYGLTGFEGFKHKWMRYTHHIDKDPKGLIDLVLSWSGFASATDEKRKKTSKLIQDVIIEYYGSLNVKIRIPYHTHIKYSRYNNNKSKL